MYAVIVSGGKQVRVSVGDTVLVDRIDAEIGSTVEIDQVLMVGGDDGEPRIGTPTVDGAVVKAEVVDQVLGAKRDAFKYSRRKRTRVRRGSRPRQTTLSITDITA